MGGVGPTLSSGGGSSQPRQEDAAGAAGAVDSGFAENVGGLLSRLFRPDPPPGALAPPLPKDGGFFGHSVPL